jgi:hypothetical protein
MTCVQFGENGIYVDQRGTENSSKQSSQKMCVLCSVYCHSFLCTVFCVLSQFPVFCVLSEFSVYCVLSQFPVFCVLSQFSVYCVLSQFSVFCVLSQFSVYCVLCTVTFSCVLCTVTVFCVLSQFSVFRVLSQFSSFISNISRETKQLVNITRFAQRVYVRNPATEFKRLRDKEIEFLVQYTQGNKCVIFENPGTTLRHLL